MGFTLIEILVAIILGVIILGTIVIVFTKSSETVTTNEIRRDLYNRAKFAIERISNDLEGCIRFDGHQRFILANGGIGIYAAGVISYQAAGGTPYPNIPHLLPADTTTPAFYSASGGIYTNLLDAHIPDTSDPSNPKAPADCLVFRTLTEVRNTLRTAEVCYFLTPKAQVNTILTHRPLFSLMRRVRGPDPTNPDIFTTYITPETTGIPTQQGLSESVKEDEEIISDVIGFNVEYLSNENCYSQLNPSPCPPEAPLGDKDQKDDGTPVPDSCKNDTKYPIRIPSVRITLIVESGEDERIERMVSDVIDIPVMK